ncbi:hypothetical protein [Agaribacterium sp. ZY112]|uniref:hypothetical protein n=1 Tax=Agaribacterium sp. ZY112 TaxID=3233574 RepID=UPI0035257B02
MSFLVKTKAALIGVGLSLLSACSGMAAKPLAAHAALIVDADAAAHKELSSLIAKAVKQPSVRLSAKMFEKSSLLVLDKPDLSGNVLQVGPRFQLLKQGDACLLEFKDTAQRWPLRHVQCVAVP